MYSNEMKDRKKILAGWLAENGDGKWYPRDWGGACWQTSLATWRLLDIVSWHNFPDTN